MKKQKGITLIALIITIIVLLILSGVALATITGNNNIIENSNNAVGQYKEKAEDEEITLNEVEEYIKLYTLPDVTTATEIQSETTEYKDAKGNKVVVPGGFKVRTDLATTVDKGIVIEDSDGNQFVWVPVGTITKSDGSEVTIELGRYTFNTSNGTPKLQQSASNYESSVPISSYYTELAIFRESSFDNATTSTNATAYRLKEWINSATSNEGYYIARYEASFGSGDKISSVSGGTAAVTNQKPEFKQSSSASSSSNIATVTSTPGMLWNYIRQGDASKACRNMYVGNEYNGKDYVDCDLVNSYAWDTAIVFIEKCSDKSNYANAYDGNGTLYNTGTDTGKTTDIVCNIYDMAGNLMEWTTEYSSDAGSSNARPCTRRGGGYDASYSYTSYRGYNYATYGGNGYFGFRGALYIK